MEFDVPVKLRMIQTARTSAAGSLALRHTNAESERKNIPSRKKMTTTPGRWKFQYASVAGPIGIPYVLPRS